MTHNSSPEYTTSMERAHERADETFGEGWEEKFLATENQRYVSENDVLNADVPVVRGYGGDHRYVLVDGAHD